MYASKLRYGMFGLAAVAVWALPSTADAGCKDYGIRRVYAAPVVTYPLTTYAVATYPTYVEPVYVEPVFVERSVVYTGRPYCGTRVVAVQRDCGPRRFYSSGWGHRGGRGWSASVNVNRGGWGRDVNIKVRRSRW